MTPRPTPIAGMYTIATPHVGDERGRFTRVFCAEALASIRPGLAFAQINLSATTPRGAVRGMHFQHPPAAEAKLIRCVRGRVFDVAVDLRGDSPTFLHWHGVELAHDNDVQVFIPEGCAHGFQVLDDDAELLYMHTQPWTPALEGRINPRDPRVGIRWPLAVTQISARDRDAAMLDDTFAGLSP